MASIFSGHANKPSNRNRQPTAKGDCIARRTPPKIDIVSRRCVSSVPSPPSPVRASLHVLSCSRDPVYALLFHRSRATGPAGVRPCPTCIPSISSLLSRLRAACALSATPPLVLSSLPVFPPNRREPRPGPLPLACTSATEMGVASQLARPTWPMAHDGSNFPGARPTRVFTRVDARDVLPSPRPLPRNSRCTTVTTAPAAHMLGSP